MENKKKLLIYILCNIIYAASQWLFIFSTLKIFGTEKTGEITLCLAINAPVFLFLNMQLKNDYIKENQKGQFYNYFYGRLTTNAIAFVIILMYTAITSSNINIAITTLSIAALKSIEGMSEICQSVNQITNEYGKISKSIFIKSLGYLLIYTTISFITNNIHAGLAVLIIYQAAVYYIFDKNNVKLNLNNENYTIKSFRSIVLRTYKLGIGSSLDSLSINGQRVIIANKIGLDALGTYAPLAQLIVIPQIFLTSINQYYFPKIHKKENKNAIIVIYAAAIIAGISGLLACEFYGDQILKIIFKSNGAENKQLLIVIAICGLVWYLSGAINIIEIANSKYTNYTLSICFALITTILFTYLFIEEQQLIGAALALLIGYACRIVATIILKVSQNAKK